MRNRAIFPAFFAIFSIACGSAPPPSPVGVSTAGMPAAADADPKSALPLQIVESIPLETMLEHADDVAMTDAAWLDMISHAKKSISLEMFYASSTSSDKLQPVIEAIGEAARRNVDVRLLFDSKFYDKNKATEDALAQMAGVHVRLIDIHAKTDGVMHAKYFVVDDADTYIGSANFDGRALDHIQEIGVRVRNPDVARVVEQVFRNDWREGDDLDPHRGLANSREHGSVEGFTRYGPKPLALPLPQLPISISFASEAEKVTPVVSPRRLMPEGYAVLDELPRLLDAIDHAKSSIDVQLLTYAVSTSEDVTHKFTDLDDALKRAAARGVHVRLLVSDWNLDDDKIESLRELLRGSKVEIEIFTIPPFSQGFIPYARVSHAKYMVVDGQLAWVGSSNWEESYFTRTRNVGLFVEGKKFAGKVDTIFESDWASKYAKAFDVNATYTPRKRDQ